MNIRLMAASKVLLAIFVASPGQTQGAREVTASETSISMPTSLMGSPRPNTLFLDTGTPSQDVCYPQRFFGYFLREKPVDRNWRIVILENQYLRVEFAPELGGMIWRLFDKIHQREILHAPQRVRPTGDGFGGAYTAGGLELNYPYAHSITNTWPRKTEYRENADGSATYVVSEWERNGRTEWAMSFTLAPGESRLKQTVSLYNRGKLPSSFVYWGNARVPAHAGTHWLFPEAMASEHGGNNLFTWPVFRGVDLSWLRTDPEVMGLYFLEPTYNYFGLVDVNTKSGLVHYADRHDVLGKKLWTWGQSEQDGPRKWNPTARLDAGGEPHMYGYGYAEVQSGRLTNQEHLEWLNPEEQIVWQEIWAPIYGLVDVNEVTEDGAFQLKVAEKKLLGYSFTKDSDVKLRIELHGKLLKEMAWSGKPGQVQEIDLSGINGGNLLDVEIKVEKAGERAGTIAAASRSHQRTSSELRDTPIDEEHSSAATGLWAEFEHKLLNRGPARDLYRKAIELDPLNFNAHLGLGKLLFAHGDFAAAEAEFERTIQANKWIGEAYLMLSQIHHIQGDLDAAEEWAYQARYYGEKDRGNLKLGEVMIARGEYRRAAGFLELALRNNADSLRAYPLLALCERKLGDTKRAGEQLARSPQGPMKDLLWYSEAWLSGQLDQKQLEQALFGDEWRFLELGLNYLELGGLQEADRVADAGIALHRQGWEPEKLINPERTWGFVRKREAPFFYLLKGAIAQRAGRTGDAARLFASGDYFEYFVDANQPEFLPVLQAAAKAGNGFASYWLGNFYYHSLRPREAIAAWEAAAAKHPGQPQILRNLAVYAQYQEKDVAKSRRLLREALALEPANMFLRLELIWAEHAGGAGPEAILGLYMEAPKAQRELYLMTLTNGLLDTYVAARGWQEAADYLQGVDRSWSDDTKTWYHFSIDYAEYLLDRGKPQDALLWISKSRPNPPNLSNVNLGETAVYRQREFFIAAQAHKTLGDTAGAQKFFRQVLEEPADLLFNEALEDTVQRDRFYTALAMCELGMEVAARGLLGEINVYRRQHSLATLQLDPAQLKSWHAKDPFLAPPEPAAGGRSSSSQGNNMGRWW